MLINKIFLSWRNGKGSARFLIGTLERLPESFRFTYNSNEVFKARKEGFENYPDFPDTTKPYEGKLQAIFQFRLMSKSRPDRSRYLSFWCADNPDYDWFDELGFTQGKLATDQFEFLADFPVQSGVTFVSEAASLTHNKVRNEDVEVHDLLSFALEKDNPVDIEAVKLFKNDVALGYVKRGHNRFFSKVSNDQLEIRVKSVDRNGNANQIYYTVKIT